MSKEFNLKWKEKFALIEKVGGVKMPNIKQLKFGERISVVFNIWGFLFSPIYYFILGMWKKALTYCLLCILLQAALIYVWYILPDGSFADTLQKQIGFISNLLIPVVFATRANIDYYKKEILNSNDWI